MEFFFFLGLTSWQRIASRPSSLPAPPSSPLSALLCNIRSLFYFWKQLVILSHPVIISNVNKSRNQVARFNFQDMDRPGPLKQVNPSPPSLSPFEPSATEQSFLVPWGGVRGLPADLFFSTLTGRDTNGPQTRRSGSGQDMAS